MSFADKFNKAVASAPEAGFVPVNYGKLTTEVSVLSWKDKQPVRTPYKGKDLKKGETLEVKFTVHISELNPALTFEYERTINVVNSSARAKTDWSEIVMPSLIKVFGKDWGDVIMDEEAELYVAVEDVPNVNGRKTKDKADGTPGTILGVPNFVKKFKNLKECKAARNEQFGEASAQSVEDEGEDEIPAAIVKQVKTLWKSAGKDEDTLRELLDDEKFEDYNIEDLIKLVAE